MYSEYLASKYNKVVLDLDEATAELGGNKEAVLSMIEAKRINTIMVGDVVGIGVVEIENYLSGKDVVKNDSEHYNTLNLNNKEDCCMIKLFGKGSTYYNKERKKWEIAFYYEDYYGNKKRKTISGNTKEEVTNLFEELKLTGFEDSHRTVKHLISDEVDKLITFKKNCGIRNKTATWYEDIGKKIKKYFRGKYIEDLNFIKIQEFAMSLQYKEDGSLYSDKTIKETFKLFKMLYQFCNDEEYHLKKMAFERIKLPRGKKSDSTVDRILSVEQLKEIYEALKDHKRYLTFVKVAVGTGARLNELLSLKWSDVQNGRIRITKQLVVEKDKASGEYIYKEADTKTACSERENALSLGVIKVLEEWKSSLENDKEYYNKICANGNQDYIFLNEDGKPINSSTFRNKLKEYLVRRGITYNVTPHMFRHCFATFMFENDVDLLTISKYLGHKNSRVTADIYTSVTEKKKELEFSKFKDKIDSVVNM